MKDDKLNRFDRIVAMLIHLQSGRLIRAQDMAERFQVSLRTIYRDIRSLEASGVPIIGESGVGYSIMDGYRLPPVMFTREEAGSFVAAEKLMQKFSDKALGAYFESAMFKIKSILRGNIKDIVSTLEAQVLINSNHELFNEKIDDALEILFEGISGKKQVSITYQSFFSDEAIERVIEPVGILHENMFWYVMGYCHLRQDYRQFRTDRISKIKRTTLAFTKEHGNIDDFLSTEKMVEKTRVVIRMRKETARYLKTGRKFYGFVSEKITGDNVEMTFMSCDVNDGLARWYMMIGDVAEIIEPESFKDRVLELLDKTADNLRPKC